MSDDSTKNRERLLDLLSRAEEQATRLEQDGHEIVRSARFQRDLIPPLRDCIVVAPRDAVTEAELGRQVSAWQGVVSIGERVNAAMSLAPMFVATSGAALNTTVTYSCEAVPLETRQRVDDVLRRIPLLEETRAGIQRLGLDVPVSGQRSMLQLLKEAEDALELAAGGDDGGAIGALIAIRQCIDSTIDALLKRRPRQEPARGPAGEGGRRGKIHSIGGQCARGELGEEVFTTIGTDIDRLVDQLSAAKGRALTRSEITDRFNRGLLALTTLLSSLDENRLRRS